MTVEEVPVRSRFEEIIEDPEAFRILLEGALNGWHGSYDVLLEDTRQYLYNAKQNERFCPFCLALRSHPRGEELCHKWDQRVASRVRNGDTQAAYVCHAGLTDVAVPVHVNGELVATIFFGQVVTSQDEQTQLRARAAKFEVDMNLPQGDLAETVAQVQVIPADQLALIRERVERLVTWVSSMGADRLAFRDRLRSEQHHRRASEIIRQSNAKLSDLKLEWDQFWLGVSIYLERMRAWSGAMCGFVLIPGIGNTHDKHIAIAVAGSDALIDHFHAFPFELRPDTIDDLKDTICQVVPVDRDNPATIHQALRAFDPVFAARIDKVMKVRLDLGDLGTGYLAMFINSAEDYAQGQVRIDDPGSLEARLIEQFAATIAMAFKNRRLSENQGNAKELQKRWLNQIAHQLVQSFGTVRSHAANVHELVEELHEFQPQAFAYWRTADVDFFNNRVKDIMYSANNGARLAHSLLRSVVRVRNADNIEWERSVIDKLPELMIGISRDFQGPAAAKKIRRMHVDTESFVAMNGRLSVIITEDLFRHAVGNLLDNAVKYSYAGTDIEVNGRIEGDLAMIDVTNTGVQLKNEDVERIFEYGVRVTANHGLHAPGTGIGLFVARDYIELNGGTVTARPSIRGKLVGETRHYRTTFTITLPMKPLDSAKTGAD
jgi:signal transduction histidine kinase